jgi:polysaccharide deacetylase 2 family uncharacterized protein YibQ
MRRSTIERKLKDAHQRLVRARQELAVVDEQVRVVDDEADDIRVRALVSESPAAAKEHGQASRHAEVMHQTRDALVQQIADLEHRQAELLDRLAVGPA